jgi:hypothetical protein
VLYQAAALSKALLRKFPYRQLCMGPGSSLSCSQQLVTKLYPETVESIPHLEAYFFKTHFGADLPSSSLFHSDFIIRNLYASPTSKIHSKYMIYLTFLNFIALIRNGEDFLFWKFIM